MSFATYMLAIITGIVGAFVILIGAAYSIPWLLRRRDRFLYSYRAKKHNEKARQLRLERTEYLGFPLPTGKSGELKITREELLSSSYFVSSLKLEKAYKDRAQDLRVDIEISYELEKGGFKVVWYPHKGRWPRENY